MAVIDAAYCRGLLSFIHQTPQNPSLKRTSVKREALSEAVRTCLLIYIYESTECSTELGPIGEIWEEVFAGG